MRVNITNTAITGDNAKIGVSVTLTQDVAFEDKITINDDTQIGSNTTKVSKRLYTVMSLSIIV